MFKKIEPKWECMQVGKLLIILHVLVVVISIWDGQNAENRAGEHRIVMPVLIRFLLKAEFSSYSVSDGLFLWTFCITHLIWSFLFIMKCRGTVDDGWRASYLLQVVQEYERAVIFRLGRLMSGGAKGPGKELHFHAACVAVWVFHLQRREFHTYEYSMTYMNCTTGVCIHLLTLSWQIYNINIIHIRKFKFLRNHKCKARWIKL